MIIDFRNHAEVNLKVCVYFCCNVSTTYSYSINTYFTTGTYKYLHITSVINKVTVWWACVDESLQSDPVPVQVYTTCLKLIAQK